MNSAPPDMDASTREFVLTRLFKHPLEAVWEAMTEADKIAQWIGTQGGRSEVLKMDMSVGGSLMFTLPPAGEQAMYGRWTYREVIPFQKLVYLITFCDEKEKAIRHPMAPAWPLEMLCTTTFSERDGQTLMVSVIAPWNATEQEHDTFDEGRDSMTQGFNHSWDQIEAFLTSEVSA